MKDARNSKVSIPNQVRILDMTIVQTPGPGAYEIEALTKLAKKLEVKNSIH